MWDPQRLTTLWAFTACYRDSFTYLLISSPAQSLHQYLLMILLWAHGYTRTSLRNLAIVKRQHFTFLEYHFLSNVWNKIFTRFCKSFIAYIINKMPPDFAASVYLTTLKLELRMCRAFPTCHVYTIGVLLEHRWNYKVVFPSHVVNTIANHIFWWEYFSLCLPELIQ
jgi:hypothetical protein